MSRQDFNNRLERAKEINKFAGCVVRDITLHKTVFTYVRRVGIFLLKLM
jgi:hypothetical protein